MNAIIRIAKNELRTLFVSPIAWVLFLIFFVQVAIRYVSRGLETVTRQQFNGYNEGQTFAHYLFSADAFSITEGVQANLIFYIPLLTMGLISRELQTGSIKLLYSAPIGMGQIVMGKFAAAVAFIALMIGTMLLFLLLSIVLVPNLDVSLALAGFLGVFLLACTYASIGLFMSSLTSHQLIAAAGTIAILAGLGTLHGIGQRIPYVGEVLYWFSMDDRADYFRQGLISSQDIAYFLSITGMFLAFTYVKLTSSQKAERRSQTSLRVAGVITATAVFGIVTSHPTLVKYWDATFDNRESLSLEGKESMSKLEGRWSMTVYANVLHETIRYHMPSTRRTVFRERFEKLVRENPRIDVDYRFFYGPSENSSLRDQFPGHSDAEIAEEFARQNRLNFGDFLSFEEAKEVIGWRAEEQLGGYYVFEWDGQREVVGTFDDLLYYPSTWNTSSVIRRLVDGPVTIGYATDGGSRSAPQRRTRD